MSKNTTQIKAAVVREKGGPFNIETLTLEGPRRDEVLIKVVATGLCHTDIVARDKGYPVPHPIVLEHEGAGIVESVGADVVKVAAGDSVVLTFLTCGRCKPCLLGRMHIARIRSRSALVERGWTAALLHSTAMAREFTIAFLGNRRLRHMHSPMNATLSRSAVMYRPNASVRSAAVFRPEPGP
jgi:Zn-dependent alcohol dehydrogenase